jgi:hypothetical protein
VSVALAVFFAMTAGNRQRAAVAKAAAPCFHPVELGGLKIPDGRRMSVFENRVPVGVRKVNFSGEMKKYI